MLKLSNSTQDSEDFTVPCYGALSTWRYREDYDKAKISILGPQPVSLVREYHIEPDCSIEDEVRPETKDTDGDETGVPDVAEPKQLDFDFLEVELI